MDLASPASDADLDRLSHITVRRRTTAAAARVAWAVRAARGWLGDEEQVAPPGMHRYHASLRLRVSDRPSVVTFGKAAYVDIGPIQAMGDWWKVDVGWRASTMAPLFPVFAGTLDLRGDELTLSGWYAPPGGSVGRLADRALLHIAAEGTARWLLDTLTKVAERGDV
jgi:plasmid stabilization system protein ParE